MADAARGILMGTVGYGDTDPVNLGSAHEITIKDLVELIARLTGFQGEIRWDSSKPDGQPRRKLDTERAKERFGFESAIGFEEGLGETIAWWRSNRDRVHAQERG